MLLIFRNTLALFFWFLRFYFLRPCVKWVLHVYTGKSEIERILQGKGSKCDKLEKVEWSLSMSRVPEVRDVLTSVPVDWAENASSLLVKLKHISKQSLAQCSPPLPEVMRHILGYHHLRREVEFLRKINYDSQETEHERMLMQLWALLKPETELSARKSRQWQEIGFQGDDPSTDFRGMGILGLMQLLYPFAAVSINITNLCRALIREHLLKRHLWSLASGDTGPALQDFHETFCSIFFLFDREWWATHVEPERELEKFNLVYGRLKLDLEQFFRSGEGVLTVEPPDQFVL